MNADYEIVLQFSLNTMDDVSEAAARSKTTSDIASGLRRSLNNWSDGRYDFPVEQIHKGLVDTFSRVVSGNVYLTENGGEVLTVFKGEHRLSELKGMWRGLCREDRSPDGIPGPYVTSRQLFTDVQLARDWAAGVSPSRHPIIVEAKKAQGLLAILNAV